MLVAETTEDLQRMVQKVEDQCMRYKLELNKDKTKSLKIGRAREDLNIRLSTGVIEQVDGFKYLGVNISDGTWETVRERIAMGQRAFGRLSKIWRSNTISTKLKLRLLFAVVVPITLSFYMEQMLGTEEGRGEETTCIRDEVFEKNLRREMRGQSTK